MQIHQTSYEVRSYRDIILCKRKKISEGWNLWNLLSIFSKNEGDPLLFALGFVAIFSRGRWCVGLRILGSVRTGFFGCSNRGWVCSCCLLFVLWSNFKPCLGSFNLQWGLNTKRLHISKGQKLFEWWMVWILDPYCIERMFLNSSFPCFNQYKA